MSERQSTRKFSQAGYAIVENRGLPRTLGFELTKWEAEASMGKLRAKVGNEFYQDLQVVCATLIFFVKLQDIKRKHEHEELVAAQENDQLKQERDEARKETAMWKANHDNQVSLKAMLMDRPDLGDRASRIAELIRERDEAREQVKELIYIAERAIDLAEIDFENDKFGVVSELRDGLEKIKEKTK
jgi:hypothetical protein